MGSDRRGAQGYEEQLSEAALITRIDIAWNRSKRACKLGFPREPETLAATPEEIETWEDLSVYFELVIDVSKSVLNLKIADRLAKLSPSARRLEKQRLIVECERRCGKNRIYYYDQHFSKQAALKTIHETRLEIADRLESFCTALRASGSSEQSEFWPLYPVSLNPPAPPDKKRSRAHIEKSSEWRKLIHTRLVEGGGDLAAMEIARRISPNNPVVPKQYCGDGSAKTLYQILSKDSKLRKRFSNLVSDVRKLLSTEGI